MCSIIELCMHSTVSYSVIIIVTWLSLHKYVMGLSSSHTCYVYIYIYIFQYKHIYIDILKKLFIFLYSLLDSQFIQNCYQHTFISCI